MKKAVGVSLIAASVLCAAEMDMGTVEVSGGIVTKKVRDVAAEELKSADLAEALTKSVPSISLVRRSGIANDIILRGQKKDNINILIDQAKIYGACPNRMDPPTSHIVTNNIESVEVVEGPYDVENFGTLSGLVEIHTKEPQAGAHGSIDLNAGSFGYKKVAAEVSGGSEKFRMQVSASQESSEQYEDGNGDTFAQQLVNNVVAGIGTAANEYKTLYSDMEAYEKKNITVKAVASPTSDQELKLSYIGNRSDRVLYPSSGMDADYDDSDIYSLVYTIQNLSDFSKRLRFELYNSEVDHPMSTRYRNASSGMMGIMTNALTTQMSGIKVKNSFEAAGVHYSVGLDAGKRNWDGGYTTSTGMGPLHNTKSINDTDTKNKALFAKASKRFDALLIEGGIRYDDTSIDHGGAFLDRSYNALSANVMGTYRLSERSSYFAGIGKSSRVPDARELYFEKGAQIGTDTLEDTKNYELNTGYTMGYASGSLKVKGFYSKLKDYIYFHSDRTTNKFVNIDAAIYGFDVSGAHLFTQSFYADYGVAYQRGKKEEALPGQTDRDLAEIPPLKANLALTYDFGIGRLRTELVAARKWSSYDSDNGEQALGGYGVVNVQYDHDFTDALRLTVGIDNLLDKTYAVSNTYKDLTLLSSGMTGDVMLLNEPGRYAYVNLRYSF